VGTADIAQRDDSTALLYSALHTDGGLWPTVFLIASPRFHACANSPMGRVRCPFEADRALLRPSRGGSDRPEGSKNRTDDAQLTLLAQARDMVSRPGVLRFLDDSDRRRAFRWLRAGYFSMGLGLRQVIAAAAYSVMRAAR